MGKVLATILAICVAAACGAGNHGSESTPETVTATTAPTPVSTKLPKTKAANVTETKKMDGSNILSMTAEAVVAGDQLKVSYKLENHSDKTVYVWDQMIGYEGTTQVIKEDVAYVFFDEPDTIRLVRADLTLPHNIDVAKKEIPFVRALAAHAKASGQISIPLPAKEYSPFYPRLKDEEAHAVKCNKVRLQIAWTEEKAGMKISERKVGDKTVLALRGSWEGPYQRVLDQMIPAQVDLQTYRNNFDRSVPLQ